MQHAESYPAPGSKMHLECLHQLVHLVLAFVPLRLQPLPLRSVRSGRLHPPPQLHSLACQFLGAFKHPPSSGPFTRPRRRPVESPRGCRRRVVALSPAAGRGRSSGLTRACGCCASLSAVRSLVHYRSARWCTPAAGKSSVDFSKDPRGSSENEVHAISTPLSRF
jgi:hypothetical protein